ncbi:MAG: roadblock/LC7 domain-containing protein [Gaiellaceae bacterium]
MSCVVANFAIEMDAGQALVELTEIASQIEQAVVFDSRGELLASTVSEQDAARMLAECGSALFALADRAGGEEHGQPTQVGLTLANGSVLLARQGDLCVLALTAPDSVADLAFFDLRACLRKVAGEEAGRRSGIGLRIQAIRKPKTARPANGAIDSSSGKDEDGAA